MTNVPARPPNQLALSAFWFALEAHWAAMLGAAMQAQVVRFIPAGSIGTATAILSATGAFFSIASQFGAGRISDRLNRRIPFVIVGTCLNVAALIGFALSPSFLAVIIAFVAVQIALNIANGPYQALIPEKVAPNRYGSASAVMAEYRLAGNAAGLILAKVLVKQPGPSVPPAVVEHGLLSLSVALSLVLLIALAITVLGVRDTPARQEPAAAVTEPWRERTSFVWLLISRSFVSMGLYLIVPFFAFFLRFALHVEAYIQESLTLLLIMIACALAGALPAGILGDRVPKKTIMFGALALLAAGAFLLATSSTAGSLVPLAIALGVAWGAYYSVDWALACTLVQPGRVGALMAIWNIGASGPQVLSPLLGGVVADRVGASVHDLGAGYRLLFEFMAAYVGLGAIALAFVREQRAGKAAQTG